MKFIIKMLVIGIILSLLQFPNITSAAPTDEEVQIYLREIGWTERELQAYLDFYEVSLQDFKNIEALRKELGTPITKESLHKLLDSYNITEEELNILLARFGEKIQDYTFIEDLDVAIDFYLTHEEEVSRAEKFFVSMGFEEREAHLLFRHILRLDKDALLLALNNIQEDLKQVTTNEEALNVWRQFFEVFQLGATVYRVDDQGRTIVNREDMLSSHHLDNATWILELSTATTNDVLASLPLNEEMLTSAYAAEKGEELIFTAQVVMQLSDKLYGTRMPQTATSNGAGMLVGLGLMAVGLFLSRRVRQ
ncbi:processed acidic surface protein [Sutcliffiella cohnii]